MARNILLLITSIEFIFSSYN